MKLKTAGIRKKVEMKRAKMKCLKSRPNWIKDHFSWNLSSWQKLFTLQHHKWVKSSELRHFLKVLRPLVYICKVLWGLIQPFVLCSTVLKYAHLNNSACVYTHVHTQRTVPTKTMIHQESSVRFTAGLCDMQPAGVRGSRRVRRLQCVLQVSVWDWKMEPTEGRRQAGT